MGAFTRAVRSQHKLRAAFDGPPGGGKTFTTLRLAFAMKSAGLCSKIAVVDTENNSASLYAGESPDGEPWEFDTLNLRQFNPDQFTSAIKTAAREGYDCVVVDSLSHAWVGAGGALDLVDQKGGNKFTAWKDVTPLHRAMIDAIIQSPIHVLVTMRSKVEYVLEEDENGKKVPKKIGIAPVQRDGMEYEFDIYCSLDATNQLRVTKTRCSPMNRLTGVKPGPNFWTPLFDWLKSAAPSQPAADQPNNSPESFRDNFIAGIGKAATIDTLRAVRDEVKLALGKGWITEAENAAIKPIYLARLEVLRREAPPAADPASKS